MINVFIDGGAGTTGLRIHDRLISRDDITLLSLTEDIKKDVNARRDIMNKADVVFLCLPDDAAKEAVTFVENPDTVVIDTSTAHRTADGWTYGFAEIGGLRDQIKGSKRIANPGCHASGFISLIAPLVENGILPDDAALSCFSLTGYSGGGKKMIAEYDEFIGQTEYTDKKKNPAASVSLSGGPQSDLFSAPRMYGLGQTHKHLPEMVKVCGLKKAPAFCPIVGDFYSGMEVVVSLFDIDPEKIKDIYRQYYKTKENSSGAVYYIEEVGRCGFLSAAAFSGRDDMQISVHGNDERVTLVSRFDNLGKGASGAAIQNMNIVCGLPELSGLII